MVDKKDKMRDKLSNKIDNLIERIKNCSSIIEINSILRELAVMDYFAKKFGLKDIQSRIDDAKLICGARKGAIEESSIKTPLDKLSHLDTHEGREKFVNELFKKVDDLHDENMKNDAFKAMVKLKARKNKGEQVTKEEEKVKADIQAMPHEDKKKIAKNIIDQVDHLESAHADLKTKRKQLRTARDQNGVNHIDSLLKRIEMSAQKVFSHRDECITHDPAFKDLFKKNNIIQNDSNKFSSPSVTPNTFSKESNKSMKK